MPIARRTTPHVGAPASMNPATTPVGHGIGSPVTGVTGMANPYASPGSVAPTPAYNPLSGPPSTPGYVNPYSASVDPALQMKQDLAGTSYNMQPLQQLESNANSLQASPWAQLQTQLARTQTGQGLQNQANQTAGQTAGAESALAQSGGLSSGARERAQLSGQQAGIGAQQGIENQGNQNVLNIGSQDAATKQQEKMALPGMETQAFNAQLEPIQMMGQAQAASDQAQMAGTAGGNAYNMQNATNENAIYGDFMNAAGTYAAANPNSPLPAYMMPGYNPSTQTYPGETSTQQQQQQTNTVNAQNLTNAEQPGGIGWLQRVFGGG